MKKEKILIIGSIAIIALSIIAIIWIVVKHNQDTPNPDLIEGIDIVENQDILKDRTVENLNIKDASIYTIDGISKYKATISNETAESLTINKLYVIFYFNEAEENNQKVLVLKNTTINSNEQKNINITSETDLTKIIKIEYVIEK